VRNIKSIIFSYDTGVSIALSVISYCTLPDYLNMKFLLTFYNICISVLSIIFSLFFAALAIIMSSSDNDFIEFLEQRKTFSKLLFSFKATLVMLFVSLVYSIILYTGSSFYIETYNFGVWEQHKILFCILELLFIYSMIATGLSILDTIAFSKFRSIFLSKKNK